MLEASFQRAKNVDPVEMELLAAEMGVPEADVQVRACDAGDAPVLGGIRVRLGTNGAC